MTDDRFNIEIDGLQLEVAIWNGSEGSENILMLHEGLGSVSLWRDFPERLAKETGTRVIAFSREGYGKSTPLAEGKDYFYHSREARRLGDVLDRLNIPSAYLFGHSDGATIALLAAGLFPQRIKGIVLEAAHIYVEPETCAGVLDVGDRWQNGSLRRTLARHHDYPDGIFSRWHETWSDPTFAAEWNILAKLAVVRCPVIAVQGDEDNFATAAQLKDIGKHVPQARIVWLENCGHEPHRTAPDRMVALTQSMLSGEAAS